MLKNILFLERQKGKFDYVVGNPPWVRIHNIDEDLRKRVNEDYVYCGKAGWTFGCEIAGISKGFAKQTDLCVPFVERAFELLRPGGKMSFVLTAKLQQALYANELRRDLVSARTLVRIIDYSLYPLTLFQGAVNYPMILAVSNAAPTPESKCAVVLSNSNDAKLSFEVKQTAMPLIQGDLESPWLLSPSDVVTVFRKMQRNGRMLGEVDRTRARMGVKTGANEIFVVNSVVPTEKSDEVLATFEDEDETSARIESSCLRPLVRGRNIRRWGYTVHDSIVWTHDDESGQPLEKLPLRLTKYFSDATRMAVLAKREDYKDEMPIWTIFRVSSEKLGVKVAWKKYGTHMQSVVLNKRHENGEAPRLLVPLQTTYFIPVKTGDEAFVLAGIFNSVVFSTFLMSYAVRARGAYFHFTAWIVGLGVTPVTSSDLKRDFRAFSGDTASEEIMAEITRLSKQLHKTPLEAQREEKQGQLENAVARAYGLSEGDVGTLTRYHDFLRPPIETPGLSEEEDLDED
jgi:Eco57I restriction-modification methylase